MEACSSLRLEGMVAKRTDSPYRPALRSDDWLKVKTADWREAQAPRRSEAGVSKVHPDPAGIRQNISERLAGHARPAEADRQPAMIIGRASAR